MSFTEKPPMLRGSPQEQINAIRDYLFRMVGSLDEARRFLEEIFARAGKQHCQGNHYVLFHGCRI